MSARQHRAAPGGAYEHPTGKCTDTDCGGTLEHVKSVPGDGSETYPGQEEYKCTKCGLAHVVSRRRWDEDGNVVSHHLRED